MLGCPVVGGGSHGAGDSRMVFGGNDGGGTVVVEVLMVVVLGLHLVTWLAARYRGPMGAACLELPRKMQWCSR